MNPRRVVSTPVSWILALSFAIHAVGLGLLYLWHPFEQESAVFSVLLFDWHWPEIWAMRVEDLGMWFTVLLGCAAPFAILVWGANQSDISMSLRSKSRRFAGLLLAVGFLLAACWELAMAVGASVRRDNFMSAWTPFFHSLRIGVPLDLALLGMGAPRAWIREVIRWGTIATTVSHGLEAFWLAPEFSNLILFTGKNLLGVDLSESWAHVALRLIAVWDGSLAFSLAWLNFQENHRNQRSKRRILMLALVCGLMAAWGLITALSRTTAHGWLMFPETLVRAVHVGGPLALIWLLEPPRTANELAV